MYQTIICGLATPDDAQLLLPKAIWSCSCLPERIHLVHISEHPLSGSGELSGHNITEPQIADEDSHWLTQIAQEYSIPAKNIHILFGSPSHHLCQLADTVNADLILLGTNPPGFLQELHSSTANQTRKHCHCDILTVYSR